MKNSTNLMLFLVIIIANPKCFRFHMLLPKGLPNSRGGVLGDNHTDKHLFHIGYRYRKFTNKTIKLISQRLINNLMGSHDADLKAVVTHTCVYHDQYHKHKWIKLSTILLFHSAIYHQKRS